MPVWNVVNIVNFIRGCEPRSDVDLVTPVKKQLELSVRYALPCTFLFQYDALTPEFLTMFIGRTDEQAIEYGLWLEIVQPLCEDAGIGWRGRFPWDWHSDVGFTVGYMPEERRRLVDTAMKKFRDTFGYYPGSVGSWTMDAVTLKYLSDRYKVEAFCDCKEQWGTDGYTLWGGYPSGGYYPSDLNMLCPGQTEEHTVRTPMFRMLGSDPIYQYDAGMSVENGIAGRQGVVTLEPVYTGSTGGGGVPEWVDWYLREVYSGRGLSVAYVQVGQENSFGWESMKSGLSYQYAEIAKLRDRKKVEVLTLGDTGRRFRAEYPDTPPVSYAALTDWSGGGRKSVWYAGKYYRINIVCEGGSFRVRDLYLFDENYRERYLERAERTELQVFDNLPAVDGNRFTGHGTLAGVFPYDRSGNTLRYRGAEYAEPDGETVKVIMKGDRNADMTVTMTATGIRFESEAEFTLVYKADGRSPYLPEMTGHDDKTVYLKYNGYSYRISLAGGAFVINEYVTAESSGGMIEIRCR